MTGLLGAGMWVPGAYLVPWRGHGVWTEAWLNSRAVSIPACPAAVFLLRALVSVAVSVSSVEKGLRLKLAWSWGVWSCHQSELRSPRIQASEGRAEGEASGPPIGA